MSYLKSITDSLPDTYLTKNLGDQKTPLNIFVPKVLSRKKVLIIAGLHGDEPGGPLGILKFLNQSNARELLDRLSVSFIPIVNYYGFENNKRKNEENKDVNRNFFSENTSKQTKIILKNSKLIVNLAKDGFLTLHEDDSKKGFFVYTYGNKKQLFDSILDTGRKFFNIQKDNKIEDGQIKETNDQSFEDFLANKNILGICTETPPSEKLQKRVEANRQIINTFLRFFLL